MDSRPTCTVSAMVALLRSGLSPDEACRRFEHEDADLVGDVLVRALRRMAGKN
jgi:hypothetical protein